MCDVGAYVKVHVPMPDDEISGVGILMTSNSAKLSLILLSQTINFIDNWIQQFEESYYIRIVIYK